MKKSKKSNTSKSEKLIYVVIGEVEYLVYKGNKVLPIKQYDSWPVKAFILQKDAETFIKNQKLKRPKPSNSEDGEQRFKEGYYSMYIQLIFLQE